MQNPTVRRATVDDAALLAELGARTFYDTYAADNTPEDMQAYLAASFGVEKQSAELSDPRCVFLIAEMDGKPAGFAQLKLSEPPTCVTTRKPIELARIYADKIWIGKGVGAALMQACLAEAQKLGCDALWLGVWERNPRGQAFYRKWGFVQVGSQTFQLGNDPQHDYVLQRSVQER